MKLQMCGQGLGKTTWNVGISRAHSAGKLLSLLSPKGQSREVEVARTQRASPTGQIQLKTREHRAH